MPVQTIELKYINRETAPTKYPNAINISSEFYKGFGEDLL